MLVIFSLFLLFSLNLVAAQLCDPKPQPSAYCLSKFPLEVAPPECDENEFMGVFEVVRPNYIYSVMSGVDDVVGGRIRNHVNIFVMKMAAPNSVMIMGSGYGDNPLATRDAAADAADIHNVIADCFGFASAAEVVILWIHEHGHLDHYNQAIFDELIALGYALSKMTLYFSSALKSAVQNELDAPTLARVTWYGVAGQTPACNTTFATFGPDALGVSWRWFSSAGTHTNDQ